MNIFRNDLKITQRNLKHAERWAIFADGEVDKDKQNGQKMYNTAGEEEGTLHSKQGIFHE